MMPRKARVGSEESAYTVQDSDEDAYVPDSPRPAKRARVIKAKASSGKKELPIVVDIEDGPVLAREHGREYHAAQEVARLQEELLEWFDGVRDKRGMPWRKRYDHGASAEEKGQRAYEIWVSEVMLQQTQVATVIDYWKRWMEKWPTIADLAKADIEEVNAAWRGLGYYRRARSLLKGAQTITGNDKYKGRLPREPSEMEKEVDGVGRYTAGAITSMAYGMRAPVVDGNVHRLFTRLFGIHAPQTAPATIKALWQMAEELVEALPERKGVTGDWNQALMELGSQVCKPIGPDCASCPLQAGCKAYRELTSLPPKASKSACDLCAPISASGDSPSISSVTVFPMRKEKKVSREENEVVCVVEWAAAETEGHGRRWLFTKRPDKGLLAGLFEPPTSPVPASASADDRYETSLAKLLTLLDLPTVPPEMISSHRHVGSIQHVFSHINMTYHILHLVLSPTPFQPGLPMLKSGIWLDLPSVEAANIGTGVKKVWSEIYGSWGRSDVVTKAKQAKPSKPKTAAKEPKRSVGKLADVTANKAKVVKQVMMPMMPRRNVEQV